MAVFVKKGQGGITPVMTEGIGRTGRRLSLVIHR
jgi:hypothetical protein